MPIKNIQTWKDLSKRKKKKVKKVLAEEEITTEVYKVDNKESADKLKEEKSKEKELEKDKRHKKLPQSFRVRWLILFVFVGAVVAWSAGWWIFSVSNPSTGGLSVVIDAPLTVTSGEEITLQLKIDNRERADLRNVEVTWQWPEGVRIIRSSADPVNDNMNTWILPDVPVGNTYVLEVGLQVFGEAGEQKNIGATLVYELANFSSVFYADAKSALTIGNPVLSLEFSGPQELEPLAEGEWRLSITNLADDNLTGVLEIEAPESFTDITTVPEADMVGDNKIVFALDDIAVGEKRVLKFKGLFSAGSQGSHEFIWRYKEANQEEIPTLQEGNYSLYVIGDEVELGILVNKSDDQVELSWGDEVEFEFLARNITAEELIDSDWEIELPGSLFDWNTLASTFSPVLEKPGVLKFRAGDNQVLESLLPGEEKRISFRVKLKVNPQPINNFKVKVKFHTKVNKEGAERISFSRDSGNIEIKSLIKWHATAHYYDDEGVQVGKGPLPPVVGQATTYRIQFNISDFSSRANKAVVTTVLPANILWAGEYNVNYGIMTYSATDRKIQWLIDDLSSYDLAQGELSAYFDIRLVPNIDALGSVLPLTGSVQLQVYKNNSITKTLSSPMLTTALPGDLYAQGKGVVQNSQ